MGEFNIKGDFYVLCFSHVFCCSFPLQHNVSTVSYSYLIVAAAFGPKISSYFFRYLCCYMIGLLWRLEDNLYSLFLAGLFHLKLAVPSASIVLFSFSSCSFYCRLLIFIVISQGINAGDVEKLQYAGIYTCNGLIMQTKKDCVRQRWRRSMKLQENSDQIHC